MIAPSAKVQQAVARVMRACPPTFLRLLSEEIDAGFAKASRMASQTFDEPEQANMRGQMRHSFCEESFREVAQKAGFEVYAPHTSPAGGRYSLINNEGVYVLRCNVRASYGPPRPSRFRKEWASVNTWIPSSQLDLLRPTPIPAADRLCAMLVITASKRPSDPSIPAFVGLGVPHFDLTDWWFLKSIKELIKMHHDSEASKYIPREPVVNVKDAAVPFLKR